MAYQIVTLGEGEVLANLFQAISFCVNAQSGVLYTPLVRLSVLVGVLWSALSILFADYTKILREWLLPLLLIFYLGLVPATSVWIIDPVAHTQQKVDHVPYGLALFSSTLNQLGFKLTRAIERVFSLPDDFQYHKTGLLFGSYLVQQAATFELVNLSFIENLNQFVEQCVTHDLLLGKYTLQELQQTPQLWQLVSSQASPLRMLKWQPLQTASGCRRHPSKIMTCKEGAQLLNNAWEAEMQSSFRVFTHRCFSKNRQATFEHQLLAALPMAYAVLGDFSQSASEILKQHAMISAIREGMNHQSTRLGNPSHLTTRQAALQQRSLYAMQGVLAPELLQSMRWVLEALAYVSFLFLVPLSILPMGYVWVKHWVNLLLWLQMWGPCYAVLNYIMTLAAAQKSGAAGLISGVQGITLSNVKGVTEAHAEVSVLASYLMMSVPFLCMALVKGVNSVVQLAGQMTSGSQSAASSLVNEAMRGNYSFGNLSGEGVHIQQTSAWQKSYASQYQGGFHTAQDGHTSLVRTASSMPVAHLSDTQLPAQLNIAKSVQVHSERQWQNAYTKANALSEQALTQHTQGISQLVELNDRLSHSEQSMDQYSQHHALEMSQGIAQLVKSYEQFAKDHQVSRSTAASFLVGAHLMGMKGFGWVEGRVGGEAMHNSASLQDVYRKAVDLAQGEEYQKALRLAEQETHVLSQNAQEDTTQQLAHSVHHNLSESRVHSESAEVSYRKAEEYQARSAYAEQEAIQFNHNQSQPFFEYVADQVGAEQAVHLLKDPKRLDEYVIGYLNVQQLELSDAKRVSTLSSNPLTGFSAGHVKEKPPYGMLKLNTSLSSSHPKRGSQRFLEASEKHTQALEKVKYNLQKAYTQQQGVYQEASEKSLLWQAAGKETLHYLTHEGKAAVQAVSSPFRKINQWVRDRKSRHPPEIALNPHQTHEATEEDLE